MPVIVKPVRDAPSPDQHQDQDQDFFAWITATVRKLRAGDLNGTDLALIAEELEDMGKSERRALHSHLRNLLLHLLKWEHQPRPRSTSWELTIDRSRRDIADIIEESPSLAASLGEVLAKEYERARRDAAKETGLPELVFPLACPYPLADILQDGLYPGA